MSAVQKHVYHYFAEKLETAQTSRIDGLIYCDTPIVNMKRYIELKREIVGSPDKTGWAIVSLNCLGVHTVSDQGPDTVLLDATP